MRKLLAIALLIGVAASAQVTSIVETAVLDHTVYTWYSAWNTGGTNIWEVTVPGEVETSFAGIYRGFDNVWDTEYYIHYGYITTNLAAPLYPYEDVIWTTTNTNQDDWVEMEKVLILIAITNVTEERNK